MRLPRTAGATGGFQGVSQFEIARRISAFSEYMAADPPCQPDSPGKY